MNFLFAWRYFKSKKSTNAINIIAWISVLAIAVGTASLIIILSVFNGFEDLVKNLYGDFYADINVSPAHGKFMQLTPQQLKKITSVKDVQAISLIAEQKAVLVNGDYQAIIYLRGVDANYTKVNHISKHIQQGEYKLGTVDSPLLVIGAGIEDAVGGDPAKDISGMVLYMPNSDAKNFSNADAMNAYNVVAAGVFSVQEEFDNKYAFTNLGFVQYMLNLQDDEFSSVEIAENKNANANDVKQELMQTLGPNFIVQTREEQNQSLFTVMEIERWIIYIILSLILLIASFNMVGALTMLVLEKQKDIAVLKALGANDSLIKNIFLSEGFLLAAIGGISGMLLALIICELQLHYHLIPLQGGSFILDYYPVKIFASDFLLVSTTVFIVALLAAFIPSRKAASQFFSLKS